MSEEQKKFLDVGHGPDNYEEQMAPDQGKIRILVDF